jgi:non-specific serine/threonine protein kinase
VRTARQTWGPGARSGPDRSLSIAASWHGGTLHLWGWDGRHTVAPSWFATAFGSAADPFRRGRLAVLDLAVPGGPRLRPVTLRLNPDQVAPWLRTAGAMPRPSDSLAWFVAVNALAAATVDAGQLTPVVLDERTLRVARWRPLADPILTDALDALEASAPPVCLPDETAVTDVHAALVDGLARDRLASRLWRPDLAPGRSPATSAVRSVFRALAGPDPIVRGGATAHLGAVDELAARLERHHRRALGEPGLLPRLRLIVPDDPFDPWEVAIELVDELDPGRWCAAADVWQRTPLALELAGRDEHLELLASEVVETARRVSEVVDVVGGLALQPEPTSVELDVDEADGFLDQAPAELARIGIELIGPERLVRADVDVRGRATPAPANDRSGGFGRDAIVEWAMVVAEDDGPAALSAAEIARAEASGATLLHTGRRWVRIDPAALRRARRRLDDHLRQHSRVDALTLLRLLGESEIAGSGAGWTAELLDGLPDERLEEAHEPPEFRGELRHYQRRGLAWFRFLDRLGLGGCLADDMGLGKTPTALAHLLGRPGPHLVVCPLSVVHNWESEAARFSPTLRVVVHHGAERSRGDEGDDAGLAGADVVVTTYGLLPRDVAHLAEIEWSTVVLDEAQMIKNPATHAARAARRLRAGQKIALTGTPVENRLAELWSILETVNPGMLGSREQFRHRFARPIERNGDADAAARLRRVTQPFVLRRSKADRQLVPDLPDKIEQIAYAGLTREQAVLYQHVVDQLLADAATTGGMKRRGLVLAALTRLKQICNHPAHALGDGSRLSGRSGKLARYDELVDELLDLGERALVFTQFREMGELLRRHAAERLQLRVPFLHGGVSRARRDAMVADFQAGKGLPLLLVSLKAGGTGLNLTAAGQVIHYDRWWNPAVEDQATDRAWRIGQSRTVVVHKLVCEGTVEERIATLIDEKRALADAVVGSGEAWLSELSTAELRELVRLEAAP